MWSGRFSVDALGRPLHCGTPNLTRSHRPRLFQDSAKCGRCQSFRPTWLPGGTGFAGMALPVTSLIDSGLVRQGQGGRSPRCPPCATSPSAGVLLNFLKRSAPWPPHYLHCAPKLEYRSSPCLAITMGESRKRQRCDNPPFRTFVCRKKNNMPPASYWPRLPGFSISPAVQDVQGFWEVDR